MAEGQPHFTNTTHVTTVTRAEEELANSGIGQGQPTAAPLSVGTPSTKPQQDPAHVLLSLGQDLTKVCDAVSTKVPNDTSTMEVIGDTSMLANDAGNKTNNGLTQVKTKKRKLNNPETNFNGEPPDFWHYLNPGEVIGDWDVLCGRGGKIFLIIVLDCFRSWNERVFVIISFMSSCLALQKKNMILLALSLTLPNLPTLKIIDLSSLYLYIYSLLK